MVTENGETTTHTFTGMTGLYEENSSAREDLETIDGALVSTGGAFA